MNSVALRIEYRPKALKQLKRIEPQKLRKQIRRRINALRMDPMPADTKKVAHLRGEFQSRSPFRVRHRSYRIFYELRESRIVILRILHRSKAYR